MPRTSFTPAYLFLDVIARWMLAVARIHDQPATPSNQEAAIEIRPVPRRLFARGTPFCVYV